MQVHCYSSTSNRFLICLLVVLVWWYGLRLTVGIRCSCGAAAHNSPGTRPCSRCRYMLRGVNPHREPRLYTHSHELPALTALAQHISHSYSGIDEKRPTEKLGLLVIISSICDMFSIGMVVCFGLASWYSVLMWRCGAQLAKDSTMLKIEVYCY